MGLFEAKGQLDRGMKDLLMRWAVARGAWRDNVAAEFQEQHLVPLTAHVRSATSAMMSAASLVSRIRADCSDR